MTKDEIATQFRSAVTCVVNNIELTDALVAHDPSFTKTDLIQFAGLGVAMTANLVDIVAEAWGTTPDNAWKIIVQLGAENNLPGMEQ